jgi:dTDP-4-dehydrorhamnose reductase
MPASASGSLQRVEVVMRDSGTILVAGRAGQLARCLFQLAARIDVPLVTVGRPELDIGDQASVERMMRKVNPAVVVNAAAYTAVEKAQTEREDAYRINAEGAGLLAKAARQRSLPFVHVSTDYVFDGRKSEPYVESDVTSPLGVYGQSKLDGETAVAAAHADAVILRTSWVYSAFGANFMKTMIRLAESHPTVRVVDDQRGTPTSAHDLALAVLKIIDQLTHPRVQQAGGIYHLTATGETTWHGFAAAIFEGLRARDQRIPKLEPIGTADYPTPAKRPAYSVLNCTKLERTFGVRLPPWRRSLDACLDQLVVQKEALTC